MGIKVRIEEKIAGKSQLAKKLLARRERAHQENEERKEEEIEESLSEIYQDSDGGKIDVNRMKIRRRQGLVFWFFNLLIFSLILIVLGLGFYYYLTRGKVTNSADVSISISAPDAVSSGEDFVYAINYKNEEYIALKKVNFKLFYPDNFIFLSADPQPDEGNDSWSLEKLNQRSSGTIKVRGKIISRAGATGILLAQMTYVPENFSSEFKKENSSNTIVKDTGFNTGVSYSDTALVGDKESLEITFKPLAENYLSEFIIRMEKDDNIQLLDTVVNRGVSAAENGYSLKAIKVKDDKSDLWLISGLQKKNETLEITYRVKSKKTESQNIKLFFEEAVGGKNYVFFEKILPLAVMKSDLNLNLIINGSGGDQPVNFGQKLNYSIAYSNKGESGMKDVVIMAVLDSSFLDWTKLNDENKGREMGDTITWTKDEIPALAKIDIGGQGTIDFSIDVLPFKESDLGKDFKITSYAQYAVGGLDKLGQAGSSTASSTINNNDNHSNDIENVINSDLGFGEQVRYFDENNMPVGNGPLPPAVGERTSFKVYWDLTNNLHDLNDVRVETILPASAEWDAHNRTSVGVLSYDNEAKKVTWSIGRLPITVFRADAEFNISLTPAEDSRNKIMVLLNGSSVFAGDLKTGAGLEKKSVPKTTKLEDDEIANMSSDGRVK
jgi:hypothetical protein